MNPEYCAQCGMHYANAHHVHCAVHAYSSNSSHSQLWPGREEREEMQVNVTKKTQGPPTATQLQRIQELKDHKLFTDEPDDTGKSDYDWMLGCVNQGMLNSMGAAGKLIAEMKKRINAKGGNV